MPMPTAPAAASTADPHRLIALALASLVAGPAAHVSAQTVVGPSLDTDSYVYFGTNNPDADELSVGVDLSDTGVYHFNFGVLAFDDLSPLGPAGGKRLQVQLEAYAYTQVVDGFPVTTLSPFGEATFKLVALDAPYSDYLLATNKPAWYDTHVGDADTIANVFFAGAGELSFDVTDTVNQWLADPQSNYGFALVLTAGTPVELGTSEGGNGPALILDLPGDTDGDGDIDDSDLGTAFANYTGPVGAVGGKATTQGDTDGDGDIDDSDLGSAFSGYTGPRAPHYVPEPATAALLGLLGFSMQRRRRSASHAIV